MFGKDYSTILYHLEAPRDMEQLPSEQPAVTLNGLDLADNLKKANGVGGPR